MKKLFLFFKMADFFQQLTFFGKTAFLKISADFVTVFQKLLFHLKDKDANRRKKLFCSSSGSGDINEKRWLNKQLDSCFCESLYTGTIGTILLLVLYYRSEYRYYWYYRYYRYYQYSWYYRILLELSLLDYRYYHCTGTISTTGTIGTIAHCTVIGLLLSRDREELAQN